MKSLPYRVKRLLDTRGHITSNEKVLVAAVLVRRRGIAELRISLTTCEAQIQSRGIFGEPINPFACAVSGVLPKWWEYLLAPLAFR